MTTAATMLDASGHLPPVDTRLLGDTIDVLFEASRTAHQCAAACLREREPRLDRCIRLNQDAADVAAATANVLIRLTEPESVLASLGASRAALRSCAAECRIHASHLQHCARCAEVCDRAEDLCLRMEAVVGNLAVVDGELAAAPVTSTGLADTASMEGIDVTTASGGAPPIHLVADDDIGEGAD